MLTIQKRDGKGASFDPKKIQNRIKKAAKGLKINSDEIFIKVITSMPTEGSIKTTELDKLVCEISAAYTGSHNDYSVFAANVAITSFYKNTNENFYETMKGLNDLGIVNDKFIAIIEKYGADKIQEALKFERDFKFDYFGWKALEGTYLLKDNNGVTVERPQHMFMRIALWVTNSFEDAIEYYEALSNHLISPATPIMINSGTKNAQLASCVLHMNDGDSREGLLRTINDVSSYSADAAGIGLCMSNIRSKDSRISKTGGYAGGLLKFIKIINESLRFFNQQGRRPGAAAIYIEPWHKDVFDLLDIRKNTTKDEFAARDLFSALWIPDNFMKAVKEDGDYYLFCPNDILKAGLKPLYEIYGEEFEAEYEKAVALGIGKKIKAADLWKKIYESQVETGVPYIAYKDHANRKSNHKNFGTIKSSNLCIEVFQYTNEKDITAICTLSSLVLKNFVVDGKFDFELLKQATRKIVKALNKVVDINHYSTEKGKKGGLSQRAIGIGVQGLADTFFLMDYDFTSEEAKDLNKKIFETIYFAALTESNELAKSGEFKVYDKFEGSPFSQGDLQFHMWGLTKEDLSGMHDWDSLVESIKKYGVVNSLLTAVMPTASSARVFGSYEMTEPITSNLMVRKVTQGEFTISNQYLISDLEDLGIWSEELKQEIIANDGSIQRVNFMNYLDPEAKGYEKKVKRIEKLLLKYRTIWEIRQRDLIDMAADRAPFIDQSQSMNIYMKEPTIGKVSSSHMHAFDRGLKTGCYYFKTQSAGKGGKHLAQDMTKISAVKVDVEKPMAAAEILPSKPENSPFECFGCSS